MNLGKLFGFFKLARLDTRLHPQNIDSQGFACKILRNKELAGYPVHSNADCRSTSDFLELEEVSRTILSVAFLHFLGQGCSSQVSDSCLWIAVEIGQMTPPRV